MSKSYLIQWKSTVNGRSGKGTKLFDYEAAHQLAEELNRQYPGIHHEATEANGRADPEQNAFQPEPLEQREAGAENTQVTHDPDPALSY